MFGADPAYFKSLASDFTRQAPQKQKKELPQPGLLELPQPGLLEKIKRFVQSLNLRPPTHTEMSRRTDQFFQL